MTVCFNYDIEMLRILKALYKYTDRFLTIFSLVDASSRRIRKRLCFSRSYVSFMREDRAVPVLPSPNISGKLVLKEGGGLGVRCEPVWPSGKAGKQRDLGSNPLRLSFLCKNCGLWTLSCDFVPHN